MRELPGRTSAQCSSRSAAQSTARLGCIVKLSAVTLHAGRHVGKLVAVAEKTAWSKAQYHCNAGNRARPSIPAPLDCFAGSSEHGAHLIRRCCSALHAGVSSWMCPPKHLLMRPWPADKAHVYEAHQAYSTANGQQQCLT